MYFSNSFIFFEKNILTFFIILSIFFHVLYHFPCHCNRSKWFLKKTIFPLFYHILRTQNTFNSFVRINFMKSYDVSRTIGKYGKHFFFIRINYRDMIFVVIFFFIKEYLFTLITFWKMIIWFGRSIACVALCHFSHLHRDFVKIFFSLWNLFFVVESFCWSKFSLAVIIIYRWSLRIKFEIPKIWFV